VSEFGAAFYGYPLSTETVTLVRRPWTMPEEVAVPAIGDTIVPMEAGREIEWQVEGIGVTRDARALIEARWDRGCFVCVGLDPDWSRLPPFLKERALGAPASETARTPEAGRSAEARATVAFCNAITAATHDHVCAFKPNAAFFEALGTDGAWALAQVVGHIHDLAPDIPVIYDAKRGDIGSTNEGYIRHAFDQLGADAITVHPYLGQEALRPFLDRADKDIIILCRTSNPGGGEFQDLTTGGRPFYQAVAERVATSWNRNGNCAVVVGATYPAELEQVRRIVGDMPILIPVSGRKAAMSRRPSRPGRTAAAAA